MDRRSFLGASAAALGSSVALAGCSSSASSEVDNSQSDRFTVLQMGIGIIGSITLTPSDNMFMGPSVTGTAMNTTDTTKSYIQLQFSIYDSEKYQIGTALANTNNLAPQAKWRFEAMSMDDFDVTAASGWTVDISAF